MKDQSIVELEHEAQRSEHRKMLLSWRGKSFNAEWGDPYMGIILIFDKFVMTAELEGARGIFID